MMDPIALAKLARIPVKVHGSNATPHAIVKGGAVVNVTRWDSAEAPAWKPHDGEAVPCDDTVGIGHLWNGTTFTDPHWRPKLPLDLDKVKAQRVAEIDRAFRDESHGLFVDDAKRHAMRLAALAAVEKARAAATIEEATTAAREAAIALGALGQPS